MGWRDQTLFDDFGQQLEDRSEWDAIAGEENPTTLGFARAVMRLLKSKLPSNAWAKHVDFLREVKKPLLMSPQQHKLGIKLHATVLEDLPGRPRLNDPEPVTLPESEQKRVFHNGVRQKYKDNFRIAGNSVRDMTYPQLEAHFSAQFEDDEEVQRVLAKKQNQKQSTSSQSFPQQQSMLPGIVAQRTNWHRPHQARRPNSGGFNRGNQQGNQQANAGANGGANNAQNQARPGQVDGFYMEADPYYLQERDSNGFNAPYYNQEPLVQEIQDNDGNWWLQDEFGNLMSEDGYVYYYDEEQDSYYDGGYYQDGA